MTTRALLSNSIRQQQVCSTIKAGTNMILSTSKKSQFNFPNANPFLDLPNRGNRMLNIAVPPVSNATSVASTQFKNYSISASSSAGSDQSSSYTNQYTLLKSIGQGAFGIVCMARNNNNGSIVAIKKVLQDPRYRNRELETMQLISSNNVDYDDCSNLDGSENCVKLLSYYKSKGKKPNEVYLNLIMEFLPLNLHQFVINYRKEKKYCPVFFIKLFSYQLFCGLYYLHSNGITHRDLKPQNVLVDPETGQLKICDFGSAKILHPNEKSVSYIASRYYRAPELMYDCEYYTDAIDIWAAGCVIAEMLLAGTPIFPGTTSLNQLFEIMRIIGRPTDADLATFRHNKKIEIPEYVFNPNYKPISSNEVVGEGNLINNKLCTLKQLLPSFTPPELLDLLTSIFVFAPHRRPTAEECLRHPFFKDLFDIPVLPSGNPLPQMFKLY